MTQTKLEVLSGNKSLIIKLDDILHLSILDHIYAIQSWEDDNGLFCIEYSLGESDVLTEYQDRELWVRILKELDRLQ